MKKNNEIITDDIYTIRDNVSEYINKKYGIKPDIEIPTLINYYYNNIKDKKFNFYSLVEPFAAAGSYNPNNSKITIYSGQCKNFYFVDDDPSLKKINKNDLFKLGMIYVMFHESRHFVQNSLFLENEYSDFCADYLGNVLMDFRYNFSERRHDELYHEIDAEYFACALTLDFLHSKDIRDFDIFLNKEYESYKYKAYVYDFDKFLKQFCICLKKDITLTQEETVKKFWNSDGTFKRFDEIYNDYNNSVDFSLVSFICTSDTFLDSIDYSFDDNMSFQLDDLLKKYLNVQFLKNLNVKFQYENGFINFKQYRKAKNFFDNSSERKINKINEICKNNKKIR